MKKISLLCLMSRQAETLQVLRDLGIVHVVPVEAPSGSELEQARHDHEMFKRACEKLALLHGVHQTDPEISADLSAHQAAEKVLADHDAIETLEDEQLRIQAEIEHIEDFGDFDPALIDQLQAKGLVVKLCRIPLRNEFEPPQGCSVFDISRTTRGRNFVLVGPESAFSGQLSCDELKVPEKSISQLQSELDRIQKLIEADNQELFQLRKYRVAIHEGLTESEETLRLLEVRASMGSAEQIAYLTGFCPSESVDKLMAAASNHGWGITIDEPDPGEPVPTQLRFPRWVKPIKGIFDVLQILPGYREADISSVFLLFFSLFFAMLIGDAGYGLLFLVGTWAVRLKMPKAPSYPFTLMTILSSCTILWGVLTGTYFGLTELASPLAALRLEWLLDQDNIMQLCFFIGAVHLSIAHIWNAILIAPSPQALAQFGWMGLTWTMFLTANTMVLGQAFPAWGVVVAVVSALLVILFMTKPAELKAKWIDHAMLPLNFVSCFVDVVSYIRLFAVGMATVSVAESFNGMAMSAGFGSPVSGLIAALILLAGHGLNIALCGLSILVHAVRLNTLEFSTHKMLQWSGFPYSPFASKEKVNCK